MTLPKSPGRVKLPPEEKARKPGLYKGLITFFQQGAIQHAAEDPADDRHDPEQPQLLQRPAALENRYRGAARRVDRGVGNRNADQMDEGQRQADSDGKARRACLSVAPWITSRKPQVRTISMTIADSMEKPPGSVRHSHWRQIRWRRHQSRLYRWPPRKAPPRQ